MTTLNSTASTTSTSALSATLRKNLELAARVSQVICLVGSRCHDRFLTPREGECDALRITTLPGFVNKAFKAAAQWCYEPASQSVELFRMSGEAKGNTATGDLPHEPGKPAQMSLKQVLCAFAALPDAIAEHPQVMLVDAHLLFEDPAAPHDVYFDEVQQIERLSRTLQPGKLLILRCHRPGDLPSALTQAPRIKIINIPDTDRDERNAYAMLRATRLAQACQTSLQELASAVSGFTEDWPLEQLDSLINVAQAQGINRLQDLDELATAVALGTTHSPWAGQLIRNAVRDAPQALEKRVLGQPQAIHAVVSRLRQSVSGLSGAHQSRSSQAPRASFFLAGPTGVGKTELAKSLSEVIYGQEQVMRFDCGELKEDHSVSRLIGAPPGYVGHDNGGELTNGIRTKPNSLVLMDEVEKAAPRLLDAFLGVLDDGRLTSGQGHTAYFGQAMVVFTSNLGMYEEVRSLTGQITRRPRFDYDTPFEDLQAAVRTAVRDEFVTRLGRPELLGRLGGAQNIIVFDFLRDLNGVTRKFVGNVKVRCANNHNMELAVTDDVVAHIAETTRHDSEALLLGGRGLALHLERILVLPLGDFIFDAEPVGRSVTASMGPDGVRFAVS